MMDRRRQAGERPGPAMPSLKTITTGMIAVPWPCSYNFVSFRRPARSEQCQRVRDKWIAQSGKHLDLDEGVTSRHRRSPQYGARRLK
jgi:hypothetical protein